MTVTAPPRPPRSGDPVDREELEALVEALIEEARKRAQRRRRRNGAVVTLVALVGVALFAVLGRSAESQTASPALSARPSLPAAAATSRIAFVSEPLRFGRQADGGLYVVNVDGSGKQQLTSARYSTPAWSPDGRAIAFGSAGGRGAGVSVMNADGSGQRRLTSGARPSWSPDGNQIAFVSGRDGNAEIYLMNADGSGQRKLVAHTARNAVVGSAPAWSPDGRKIAFVSDRDGMPFRVDAPEISVVNVDGSGQRNLTSNPAHDSDPVWSPDGRRIVFVRNFEIYVMNADGSGQQNLTRNAAHDFAPAWSPNGQQIAFERRLGRRKYRPCAGCGRASIFEVRVMNTDGSGPRRLTRDVSQGRGEGIGARPRWSPDGSKIAFVSERDGNAEVYLISADGSGRRNLTRNPRGHEYVFAWSPAQTK